MPIEYTSRSGEKYYLHLDETKPGKPKHYVARRARGPLADAIPDGFEMYESSKGRVSLRRILPKVISDKELIFVEQQLACIARLKGSCVERKLRVLQNRFRPGLFIVFSLHHQGASMKSKAIRFAF